MGNSRFLNVDLRQINRWTAYRELLPEVLRMNGGCLRELLDAIPKEMSDLRKAIAERIP